MLRDAELAAPPARELLADLTRRASRGTVTLVYGQLGLQAGMIGWF